MNREHLAWALRATLPHAGRVAGLDVLTVTSQRLWATDRATVGISTGVAIPDCRLSRSDAADLLRFARPGRVAERAETVVARLAGSELHVGILDAYGELADSAVYPVAESADVGEVTWQDVESLLARMSDAPPDYRPAAYVPDVFARFSAASDISVNHGPARLYLRRLDDAHLGTALVTVGQHFYGAIGGVDPSSYAAAPWPFPPAPEAEAA